MSGAANMGWARAVGIVGGGLGAPTYQLEFDSCGISKQGVHIAPQGVRGSRSHIAENVADGPYTVGGPLNLGAYGCKPDVLTALLPWIMGSTFVGTVITIGDTLTDKDITMDWGTMGVPRANNCRVNTASFASASGSNLTLGLEVEGLTWTMGAAASFPAISATLSNLQPYVHHNGTFTLNSIAMGLNSANITISHNLITDRFQASAFRTELPSSDLGISVDVEMPFVSDYTTLYDMAVAGVSASFVYTNGTRSITFAFANLKAPAQAIQIARNAEMVTRIPFQAYRTSSTACLVVTNDDT
jgi:hypothetical protein